jgi:fido (protein-threonine AMPylation protein)
MTAQERAEQVLAQVEAALRVAQATRAPSETVAELRAIHRRLHQAGLRQELQGSFF